MLTGFNRHFVSGAESGCRPETRSIVFRSVVSGLQSNLSGVKGRNAGIVTKLRRGIGAINNTASRNDPNFSRGNCHEVTRNAVRAFRPLLQQSGLTVEITWLFGDLRGVNIRNCQCPGNEFSRAVTSDRKTSPR